MSYELFEEVVLTNDIPDSWEFEKGRIDKDMLKKHCSSFEGKYFSLCGPLGFIESMAEQLEKEGVLKSYIEMERFK